VSRQPEIIRKLVLAGASPEKDFQSRLRAAIQASGHSDRIVLTGLLDERSLLDEFARASALVLPSYQETSPMVIQQAMAAGLPVIATRVGGIPDLIEHGVSGLLFDAGDAEALGELIRRLHDDMTLGPRLAASAKAIACKEFRADSIASATMAAYRQVMSKSRFAAS
jgi:glycosyltransferase involved in cell wall biosynthesis